MSELRIIKGAEIRRLLDYETCIPLIREAMIALSRGETRQLPRGIIDLEQGRAFGAMTGALGRQAAFGAKIVSVFPDNFAKNRPSHQGVLLLFDPESGAPAVLCEAGAVTAIRTAAASAVATDALARPDATRLAILGYGEQAREHIAAIARVRRLSAVTVWGRSPERAKAFAANMTTAHGLSVTAAPSAEAAVADADIICTVTAASEPILKVRWVAAGTHVNLWGGVDITLAALTPPTSETAR